MIPASATNPEVLEQLVYYLRTELWKAQGARRELEQMWIDYDFSYRAKPESPTKTYPFEGASNLVLPIIATDVDTIFSRIMGILFTPENLWSCRALNEAMVDYAPRLQEFLQWAQDNELGVYDAVADWVLELTKMGTAVLKQRYRREMKRVYQFRETDFGTIEQQLNMLIKDSPRVDHVSLYDFYVPPSATNLQDAPWCAERIMLSWNQLMERARAGLYVMPTNIGNWWIQSNTNLVEEARQRLDLYVPPYPDRFECFEFWLDYDLSGTGSPPQAIVATVHIPSQSLLRVDYNPFFNQEKPYSYARYLRQEKRFYGIGLCEMGHMFQKEVSTMHNQRIDNKTLANTSMYKARKGIGIRENEPIIPGRWFLLDDMDDVQTMQMGQRFDSTIEDENLTLQHFRARDGVNDYIQGKSTPAIGYGAATTTTAMLQEGAKRFDQVLREIRRCLGETGTRVVELYQQFNQRGKEYLVMGEKEGAMVHEVLQFPLELIRTGVAIDVTATSASMNKEMEIRNNMVISQLVMQYYQQLMQAASYLVNPQMPPLIKMLAQDMIKGGTIFLKRILDNYGVQDADKIIPDIIEALNGQQQQLNSLQGTFAGGVPGAPPNAPVGGVQGDILPGAGGMLPAGNVAA